MKRIISSIGVAAALSIAPALATTAAAQEGAVVNARHDLDARIHDRIKADASLRPYDIDVNVTDRVATLSGTVATNTERARAARLARIDGVSRVENDIRVDRNAGHEGIVKGTAGHVENGAVDVGHAGEHAASRTGEAVTDGWITSRIHERFMGVKLLKDSDINVDTNNHVVTLKGTVLTEAGRLEAVRLAKGTEGVHDVVDHLSIGRKDR
ncbi:MAG: BON domain-containing protein [Vicinamibacterales bacterium]